MQLAVRKSGSQAKLAERIGKKQGHVWSWLQRGYCPPEMALVIECETGVPKEDLRPDLYLS